jgi:hypothetical protein
MPLIATNKAMSGYFFAKPSLFEMGLPKTINMRFIGRHVD